MIDLNLNPSKKDLRIFSLALLAFLTVIALLVWRRTGSAPAAGALLAAGLVGAVLGFAVPRAMRPAFIALQIINFPIGWTVSHVIVAVIFYLVVTPIGVIMRLSGRDPMERTFDRAAKTYWKPRRTDSSSSRYFRQF